MEPEKLLEALHTAEKLKDTTRHCYTSKGRHESVAEHSWRIALMAFWLRDEFPQADMDKVIRMCLIHDLGECFTGDIPAFDKTAADEAAEEALLSRWVDSLPEPVCTEMRTLYAEMAALQTTEAKIYKALDKNGGHRPAQRVRDCDLGAAGVCAEPDLRRGAVAVLALYAGAAGGHPAGNAAQDGAGGRDTAAVRTV